LFKIDKNLVNVAASIRAVHEVKTEAAPTGDTLSAEALQGSVAVQESNVRAINAAKKVAEQAQHAAKKAAKDALDSAALIAEDTMEKAKTDAADIISYAKSEADKILNAAREQGEADRARAEKEGFDEGFAKGEEQGLAAGQEEGRRSFDDKVEEDDEMLRRVIVAIHEERERAVHDLEDDLVNLALGIVRKVIHLENNEEVFGAMIRNALKEVDLSGKLVIRVCAEDYERFFESGVATFETESGVTVTAAVLKDPSLSDGDCIIDTETETLNAGMESQLKYVELAFNQAEDIQYQTL